MESLIVQVIETLRQRGQTLCLAESCTGGLLASQIVALPGVSDVFMGSFVTYSNQMKRDILEVSPRLLKTMGAVSQTVALQMAQGTKHKSQAHWSASITGLAGPSGGTDKKPVGTVCFAIIGPGVQWTDTQFFSGSRTQIQELSAEFAIQSLLDSM